MMVTRTASRYILNCYSFIGGRPSLRFDSRLRIPGLPEVRASRRSAATSAAAAVSSHRQSPPAPAG
jgi:hypothetical protein